RNQPAIHGERGRVLCSRHRPDGGGSRHLAGSGGAPFGAVGHLPSRHAGNGAGPPHPGGGKGYGHHHDHGRRGDGNRSGGDPGRGCRFHRQADPDGAISEDPSKLPAAVGKAESLRNHDPAGNRPVVESGNGGHRFPMGGGPGGPQGDRSPHPGKSGVRPPRFSSAGYDGGRDGPGDRSQPLHRPPLPGISRFRRGGRRRRFLRIGGKAGAAVCPEVRRKRGAEVIPKTKRVEQNERNSRNETYSFYDQKGEQRDWEGYSGGGSEFPFGESVFNKEG